MVSTKSLKQNHLFRRLYQKGKSSAGRCLVVYCRKNGLSYNRLGLTTGTKLGHAVVRNRIRRRIREAYRLSESAYVLGYDIVVVARHRAVDASFQEIQDCLLQQFDKLGLIRKEEPHEASASVAHPVLPE
jgi:ribonuclease P protein component